MLEDLIQKVKGCFLGEPNCVAIQKFNKLIAAQIGFLDGSDFQRKRADRATEKILKLAVSAGGLTKEEKSHLFPCHAWELIEHWKADDRDARSYSRKQEKYGINREEPPLHPGADGINPHLLKTEWERVGAITSNGMAQVRVRRTGAILWVDLSDIKKPSRNAKRRFNRYGKGVAPKSIIEQYR